MAENSSHAPGKEITGSPIGQHKMMAESGGVMAGGNFGVGAVPGSSRIKAPEGAPTGKMLPDSERAGTPNFKISDNHMHATANPGHGPHHHPHAIHMKR
jgi:hypothetical protein